MSDLPRTIEALLFLSPQPVSTADLAEATEATEGQVAEAIDVLREDLGEGRRGVVLREVAGGFSLASDPASEEAARRLLAKPRTPPLTQAQAETLAIVAYLQPVSRPEVARIRGVSSESAVQTLAERGLIEESGRSQFGAALFKTTELFERALRPLRPRPAARPLALRPDPRGRARAARAAAQGRGTARRVSGSIGGVPFRSSELSRAASRKVNVPLPCLPCGWPSTSRTGGSLRGGELRIIAAGRVTVGG